jgi:hypothetical protein
MEELEDFGSVCNFCGRTEEFEEKEVFFSVKRNCICSACVKRYCKEIPEDAVDSITHTS